jgi:hypothetical protein
MFWEFAVMTGRNTHTAMTTSAYTFMVQSPTTCFMSNVFSIWDISLRPVVPTHILWKCKSGFVASVNFEIFQPGL